MKVLFIYPGISNIGFNAYHEKGDSVDSWYIPIGVCYLAAVTKREGHEVDILDLRFVKGYDEVEQKIAESGCDIAALSFQTPGSLYARKVAEIAKRLGKITVAGGIHPSVLPDETAGYGVFDHVVIGEGCITFPQMLKKMEQGHALDPIITGEHVWNLDDIPFPYYFDLYADAVIKKHKIVMMFTSRGCPGKCTFCQPVAHTLFGRRLIFRSAENIIAEALHWQKLYGITRFMLVDDTFMVKKKLVHELCRTLINLKTGMEWTCNGRVNEFDDETVRLMAESGCKWICIGFESGSQRLLDLTKKATTVEQGYRAAELCHKYDIGFTTNILAGIPGETEDDLRQHLDFVTKIKATNISYNWLVPYPGTDVYEECKEKGLLDKEIGWDGYEMNKIKRRGIITSVDYELVRKWEDRITFWSDKVVTDKLRKIIGDGNDFESDGLFDRALERFTLILTDHPDEFYGYFYCGKLYKKTGKLDLAQEHLKKAVLILEKDKDMYKMYLTSAHFHLGEIYYRTGRPAEAQREFTICLELNEEHVKAQEYLDVLRESIPSD